MRNCVKSIAATLCLLMSAVSANAASNLIANHDFNQNVDNWTLENPGNSTLVWTGSQSAAGMAGSGSGLLTAPVNSGNWNADADCVTFDFPAGSSWNFGGWVRIPSVQSGTGSAGIGIVFYQTADCSLSLPYVAGDFITAQVFVDVWDYYERAVVLPTAAHSARLYLNIDQSTNGKSFGAYFDGLLLTDQIFQNGFEIP